MVDRTTMLARFPAGVTADIGADDLQALVDEYYNFKSAVNAGITTTNPSVNFTVTLPDDTLTYNIAPTNATGYEAWLIGEDLSAPPAVDALEWTVGVIPEQGTLSDWVQTTLSLWTRTALGVVAQIGSDVLVYPNDTAVTGIREIHIRSVRTTDSIETILTSGYFDNRAGLLVTDDVLVVRKTDPISGLTDKDYLLRVVYSGVTVAVEEISLQYLKSLLIA